MTSDFKERLSKMEEGKSYAERLRDEGIHLLITKFRMAGMQCYNAYITQSIELENGLIFKFMTCDEFQEIPDSWHELPDERFDNQDWLPIKELPQWMKDILSKRWNIIIN